MKISYVSPNKVKIADKSYKKDLAVSTQGEVFNWQREGDELTEKEIQSFLKKEPELVVVSKTKDFSGVSHGRTQLFKEKDVTVVVDEIHEAINVFNKAVEAKKRALIVLPLG